MEFDFIVIGAGSSGCAVAGRLSENGKFSVLLLEAGGRDWSPWLHIPIGYGKAYYNKRLNWMYYTEPEDGLGGRQVYWPRGKVLGGSSAINAMIFIRGQAQDFEDWKALGNSGWGWDDVLPYFKRLENSDLGDAELRGKSGPVQVESKRGDVHPSCEAFFRAADELGVPRNSDFNGSDQTGSGIYQITTKGGRRMSAARAYLYGAKRRNLKIETHAHVQKIELTEKRATGVTYIKNGQSVTAQARREVILSAGAIGSPQILQLSGIGPGQVLHDVGVEVVHELPGVGRNLQDHLCIDHGYRARVPTLNNMLAPFWRRAALGARYILTRSGPLSLGINHAGAFLRSRTGLDTPNMQIFYSPLTYTKPVETDRPLMRPDQFAGFYLSAQPTRPTSRGYLQIRSADPAEAPAIHPGYLSTAFDQQEMLEATKLLRKFAATKSLSGMIEEEFEPGFAVQSEEELIDDIKARASTIFHPVSTCRMGPDRSIDVVDGTLKVHGIRGLRVADASIFPTMTSGNTNAPALMVGEKASDLILSEA